MSSSSKGLITAVALMIGGAVAFFLFLYITGHDPDERPLSLVEWVIAGILIGPGFGYLLKWKGQKGR
ncbi:MULTISPECIES: hypothetical protein [unclassified Rhizobium]|uniref:hypothetical protein n=1 Tax=unclassified Rhizobium TaxID=2613769 RepID=UPI000DE00638|nr:MULTISPECIES: hypothetical protein [unclassified Rhizobium]MBB3289149.1 uncharacterized membrane-anchored protein YitT (DUF2179 family) [Rhizobium sp. BK252]MBB3403891.1 uncharacterized membrane-anchored protein YitT (DUF2179 family) [Rhizobium sp. BK289]MBB3416440.1 uncharacterized membrane-anchored protein YitT (DUF2179 family) [Rhizobium sp. BK284]MBB3484354.1 uncharacterized membrane-anchored protein YitT (DUF2179 family) [Rhizobium sp. BK347]MDK4718008.1 hypothetical protein [Rhizobium